MSRPDSMLPSANAAAPRSWSPDTSSKLQRKAYQQAFTRTVGIREQVTEREDRVGLAEGVASTRRAGNVTQTRHSRTLDGFVRTRQHVQQIRQHTGRTKDIVHTGAKRQIAQR